jgi:hypothetical protein
MPFFSSPRTRGGFGAFGTFGAFAVFGEGALVADFGALVAVFFLVAVDMFVTFGLWFIRQVCREGVRVGEFFFA